MSSGDAFGSFAPNAPSTLHTGNAKPLQQTTVPEAPTWGNFQPIQYQYVQNANDPREFYRNMSQNNNPSIDPSVAWKGNNIGQPGDYTPNNRVTDQIQKDDPDHTNSYVKQAEQVGHRMLSEMGSGDWLKQVKSMANTGQVSSILGLLQGAMGSAGSSGSGAGSNTGSGGMAANGMPTGMDLTDIVSGWTADAVAQAQNQNNAQENGLNIPWFIDITQPGVIDPVIGIVNNGIITVSNTISTVSNTISNVVSSLTVARAPQ